MSGRHDSAGAKAATQEGTDRRHSARYRVSEPMVIRCAGGSSMTGISVEISEGGMSAMVNGLLRVGDLAEIHPVAGGPVQARVRHKLGLLYGFEFMEITAEQVGRIAENWKKSYACRTRGRNP